MKSTDFGAIESYSSFVSDDPFRQYLHYPAVICEVMSAKSILDVGCGDGRLAYILAKEGKSVTGYDIAEQQIKKAKELNADLPCDFQVCGPASFKSDSSHFDAATSVLVLPYAEDQNYLHTFFSSSYNALKNDSLFVSIVFNPGFDRFGELIGTRRFELLESRKVEVHFLSTRKEKMFTSVLHQYSKSEYEIAVKSAGFKSAKWQDLEPSQNGLKAFKSDFWSDVIKSQPYQLLIAQK